MLRQDNVSRRTDESNSELVVKDPMSKTAHNVYSKGNDKSSGEFIEDTKKDAEVIRGSLKLLIVSLTFIIRIII